MTEREFSKNFASSLGKNMLEASVSKPSDDGVWDVHILCLNCVELGFKNLGLGFLKTLKTSEVRILGF